MSYGAAYYPYLRTNLVQYVNEATQAVTGGTIPASTVMRKPDDAGTAALATSLYHINSKLYFDIKKSLDKNKIILAPSSAIAGVYCQVDNNRGVWKAPANVSLSLVNEPMVRLDDEDQRDMNVTDSGKSVNAIRAFMGKGILVWGARTLAGNDNEWRYISVRRFFNMVEESVKKASEPFVFEPNDANTWVKVKGMIENFLTLQWRAGALQGSKPEESFFVHVGLGETMTALDILEGRMIVEIGMAVVRPAEFIILRFSHKMVEA
jgi:phage tail sheath protein FI